MSKRVHGSRRKRRRGISAVIVLGGVVVLGCAVLAITEAPQCMVGYWRLDETLGAVAADSTGGNNGVLTTDGDAQDPSWQPGRVGNGLYFPGDLVDSVVVQDAPGLRFGSGAFAIELWLRYDGPTDGTIDYPCILSKRPGPRRSNPVEGFALCLSYWTGATQGSLLLRIAGKNYVPCATRVDDGEWHHVVAQRSSDHDVEFYVDGQLDGTARSSLSADTTAGLRIGVDSSSSFSTKWIGMLDELALYSCCLPVEVIRSHYEAGLRGEGYD